MSLADELIADLEDDEAETGDVREEPEREPPPAPPGEVRELARLRDSERLRLVTSRIDSLLGAEARRPAGPVEADPEYRLIVEANDLAAEIDAEIGLVHRFVADKYRVRFPELESLVVAPLDYVRAVAELGDDLDGAKSSETLPSFLTQATVMVVSVTASATQGRRLTAAELEEIRSACRVALDLDGCKRKIHAYVESRMAFVAPNLSAVVGASVAAEMTGAAGGLTRLSKMAACDVLSLGRRRRADSEGFVHGCALVREAPPDLRRKAARFASAKATLAARVDACHESASGEIGRRLREEVERKLDRLQEPPPVKFARPLPKPVEQSRKRRGGRRVRKTKERYAVTELRKTANRLSFGDIEDDAYQEDLGYSRGAVGKSGAAGRVRLPQVDEKTKVRISKTLQRNLQKQQHTWGGSTTVRRHVSGTASSVAFTPLQGLEIVNPQAAEHRQPSDADNRYFSNTSGFLSVTKQ